MIHWLFWPSLVLLVWLVIVRFFPRFALKVCALGALPLTLEEAPIAAAPPSFLLRAQYPKDGC